MDGWMDSDREGECAGDWVGIVGEDLGVVVTGSWEWDWSLCSLLTLPSF